MTTFSGRSRWSGSTWILPANRSPAPDTAHRRYSASRRGVALLFKSAMPSLIAALHRRFDSVTPQGRASGWTRGSVMSSPSAGPENPAVWRADAQSVAAAVTTATAVTHRRVVAVVRMSSGREVCWSHAAGGGNSDEQDEPRQRIILRDWRVGLRGSALMATRCV